MKYLVPLFWFHFFAIILNALSFISFFSFQTHAFGDKTLRLPIHLLKLIMNKNHI